MLLIAVYIIIIVIDVSYEKDTEGRGPDRAICWAQLVIDRCRRVKFVGSLILSILSWEGPAEDLLNCCSVYYFFFERCRDIILTSKSKVAAANATTQAAKLAAGGALTTLESMLAGAIAGSATTIISNPIWVISTRQAVRSSSAPQRQAGSSKTPAAPVKKLGFIETIQHILKSDGITAFWKGLGPSLVLVINPILQYTAFERLRSMAIDSKKKRGVAPRLNDLEVFFLGALSKLFATGLTYPQIVIKSRQQSGAKGNSNVWTAMTDVVNREG